MVSLMVVLLRVGLRQEALKQVTSAPQHGQYSGNNGNVGSSRLPCKLADIVLVAEQKIGTDDAMIEAVGPKPIVDESNLARAPVQRGGRAVDARRGWTPEVVNAVERERARLVFVPAADQLDAVRPAQAEKPGTA